VAIPSDASDPLRAQTLRLEEHDDPTHPVVVAASERIVELGTRKSGSPTRSTLSGPSGPPGTTPTRLWRCSTPCLTCSPALNAASDEELVEIFRAFDLTITYDKHEQRLHLAATITPELLPVLCSNESDRPEGRSQINDIAGAGFEPATFGL
jgi:hypothetical protein